MGAAGLFLEVGMRHVSWQRGDAAELVVGWWRGGDGVTVEMEAEPQAPGPLKDV